MSLDYWFRNIYSSLISLFDCLIIAHTFYRGSNSLRYNVHICRANYCIWIRFASARQCLWHVSTFQWPEISLSKASNSSQHSSGCPHKLCPSLRNLLLRQELRRYEGVAFIFNLTYTRVENILYSSVGAAFYYKSLLVLQVFNANTQSITLIVCIRSLLQYHYLRMQRLKNTSS